MDSILGQIILFAGGFVPHGWALCNGASLSIAENAALFSLLGTTYGGDGMTTFNLPTLSGPFKETEGTLYGSYIIAIQGIYPTRD